MPYCPPHDADKKLDYLFLPMPCAILEVNDPVFAAAEVPHSKTTSAQLEAAWPLVLDRGMACCGNHL